MKTVSIKDYVIFFIIIFNVSGATAKCTNGVKVPVMWEEVSDDVHYTNCKPETYQIEISNLSLVNNYSFETLIDQKEIPGLQKVPTGPFKSDDSNKSDSVMEITDNFNMAEFMQLTADSNDAIARIFNSADSISVFPVKTMGEKKIKLTLLVNSIVSLQIKETTNQALVDEFALKKLKREQQLSQLKVIGSKMSETFKILDNDTQEIYRPKYDRLNQLIFTAQANVNRLDTLLDDAVAQKGKSKTWKLTLESGPKGVWKTTWSVAIVPDKSDRYFLRQDGTGETEGFEVVRQSRSSEYDLIPSMFFTYQEHDKQYNCLLGRASVNATCGWALGLGLDSDSLTPMAGWNWTWNDNIGITIGAAAVQQARLRDQFRQPGVRVTTTDNSDDLTEDVYRARLFLALSYRFK